VTGYEKVDFVVVRENTRASTRASSTSSIPRRTRPNPSRSLIRFGSDRIIRLAEHARAHGRKRRRSSKANILKMTSGLFFRGRGRSQSYPDIEFTDIIVDNCADAARPRSDVVRRRRHHEPVRRHPERPDGWLAAGPARAGRQHRRASGGVRSRARTAPDIAGKGIANPVAPQ
jgi:isocitrate/isopropylmalate dehydrogenase